MKRYWVLLPICFLFGCHKNIQLPHTEHINSDKSAPERFTVFEFAEKITGAPRNILYGIAVAESNLNSLAVGDNGNSLGLFQINECYRSSRVELVGYEYDAFDAFDSALIAGYIYMENMQAFDGNERLAIAAYRQGITGVRMNGATDWYVDKVISAACSYNTQEIK